MKVYRLSKGKYKSDLSGRGAEIAGGRWNNKGIAVVYTSASRALCTTEIAVRTPLGILPLNYFIIEIEIPKELKIEELKIDDLPKDWKSFPHSNTTQQIGDKFIKEEKSVILKVPSAVVQGDYNYLLNPKHKNFNKIKITNILPFNFDKRLFIK